LVGDVIEVTLLAFAGVDGAMAFLVMFDYFEEGMFVLFAYANGFEEVLFHLSSVDNLSIILWDLYLRGDDGHIIFHIGCKTAFG
jgi:hypothetical protein